MGSYGSRLDIVADVLRAARSLQAFIKNTVLCEGQQGTVSENGHIRWLKGSGNLSYALSNEIIVLNLYVWRVEQVALLSKVFIQHRHLIKRRLRSEVGFFNPGGENCVSLEAWKAHL